MKTELTCKTEVLVRFNEADPLGIVEQIYADFDYPHEMVGFVRWMPAAEPVLNEESGLQIMYRNWLAYLSQAENAESANLGDRGQRRT